MATILYKMGWGYLHQNFVSDGALDCKPKEITLDISLFLPQAL